MDFLSLGIAVFASLLVQLLTPTPDIPKPKKYGLSEFDFPTATEDRALPLIFGTVPVSGNVLWSGDYRADELSRRVRVSLFKKTNQTYGYAYHVGMWLSLAGTTVDETKGVQWGDKDAWTGSLPLSKTGYTDLPVSYQYSSREGQEAPDGLAGTLRFFNQDWVEGTSFVPVDNAYMRGQLGVSAVPAYPGTCHVVLLGPSAADSGFVGSGPNIPPLKIVVKRLPAIKPLLGQAAGLFVNGAQYTYPVTGPLPPGQDVMQYVGAFIDAQADIDDDANPAFVIAELLCSRAQYIGPRLALHALDWGSFMRAAEVLKSEGHGVSFAWEESRSVGDVISDIAKQINAVTQIDEATGRIQLKLIRESDQPLHHFDSSNFVEQPVVTRVVLNEAPNLIQVPYIDRALKYESRTVGAKNLALVQQTGAVISREAKFIGVSNSRLASILATRELRSGAASLAKIRFSARMPLGKILKPGDVVTVTHERLGQAFRMRVTSGRWNDYSNRQVVEFEAVEDVFRSGSVVYENHPTVPGGTTPGATVAASSPVIVAAPYALTGEDFEYPMYYAETTSAATRGLRLAIAEGSAAWSAANSEYSDGTESPAISGTLVAVLRSTSAGTTAQLALTADQAAAWRAMGTRGEVLGIINGEWVAASGATLSGTTLTLPSIKRGIFDTSPRRHEPGSKLVLLLGYFIDTARMQTRLSTSGPEQAGLTSVVARVDSVGPAGTVFAAAAPGTEARLNYSNSDASRALRPLPQARVNAGQAGVGSLSDPWSSVTRGNFTLSWTNRNRLSRRTEDWFSATNDAEANVYTEYAFDWETTPGGGQFTANSFIATAVGAASATVDASQVPAGARFIRIRIRAVKQVGSGYVRSTTYDWFWQMSA